MGYYMKICYDNLEDMYLSYKGTFRKNGTSYVEAEACLNCGEIYITQVGKHERFCSKHCSNSYRTVSTLTREKMSINNGNLKGNVTKLNLPLFDTFVERLQPVEETRIKIDACGRELLEVKCSKCNAWFIPSIPAVYRRAYALVGDTYGENRFYCSEDCKNNCEVYGKNPNNYLVIDNKEQFYNNYELSIWSKEVLKRANYKCEYCGQLAEHAHHIQPKKLEPGIALDPVNGLGVCKKCHYRYGHSGECASIKLGSNKC